MNLVYSGKTKDVYALQDGNFLLQFKDDATGADGVFDPGANQVALKIDGSGKAGLQMSVHYFQLLQEAGIKTHFLAADLENVTMTVIPVQPFGKGVEVICRLRSAGSFAKRFGQYAAPNTHLPEYVEMTLKDDERGDPIISQELLVFFHILSPAEYDEIVAMTKKIALIVRDDLAAHGLELYDLKLEFGRADGVICLMDEVSGGCMRVFKGDQPLDPIALSELITIL